MAIEPPSEMTSYGPADQRLWGAVDDLIVLDGSLALRLKEAWKRIRELQWGASNRNDFRFQSPKWLDEELQPLLELWEKYDPPYQIEEAVDGLTEAQRRQHARDILEWFARLREEKHAYELKIHRE